jgi:nicotinamidase/pyrazinamidase
MNALLIVDVQNDFIPGGSLPVPQGDEIIPLINSLQHTFNLIVATQDWHPAHHKSFASSHAGKKPFDSITLHGLEQVLWPDHCIQGSTGAAFHHALDMNKVEAIFRKGMESEIDSYSGFYDNGHKKSTGLAGYLREHKVQEIFICGLAADYCVFYTAKDALQENFKTYIIEDATRAINPRDFEKAKSILQAEGGQLIESKLLHRHL